MIIPTGSRTVVVPSDTNLQNSLVLAFPNAMPTDVLDYWVDVHNVTNYTDSIASFSIPTVAGLTITKISTQLVQGLIVGFYITGGTLYQTYQIPVSVVFASGSTFVANCSLSIGVVNGQNATGAGTVSNVAITSETLEVSGSPITTTGTVDVELTAFTGLAGTYANANISSIVIDQYGRVVSISTSNQAPITFYFELEDGSGALLLESGAGYLEQENGP